MLGTSLLEVCVLWKGDVMLLSKGKDNSRGKSLCLHTKPCSRYILLLLCLPIIITRGAKREGTVIVLNRMSVSSSVISGSKRFSSGLI